MTTQDNNAPSRTAIMSRLSGQNPAGLLIPQGEPGNHTEWRMMRLEQAQQIAEDIAIQRLSRYHSPPPPAELLHQLLDIGNRLSLIIAYSLATQVSSRGTDGIQIYAGRTLCRECTHYLLSALNLTDIQQTLDANLTETIESLQRGILTAWELPLTQPGYLSSDRDGMGDQSMQTAAWQIGKGYETLILSLQKSVITLLEQQQMNLTELTNKLSNDRLGKSLADWLQELAG